MSEWISVSEQLPKEGQHGLCSLHSFNQTGGSIIVVPFTFLSGQFHPFADEDNIVHDDYWHDPLYWPTNWQPFPPPPAE